MGKRVDRGGGGSLKSGDGGRGMCEVTRTRTKVGAVQSEWTLGAPAA